MDENAAPNVVVDRVAAARAAMLARGKKGKSKSPAQLAADKAAAEKLAQKKANKGKKNKQSQVPSGMSKADCGFSH